MFVTIECKFVAKYVYNKAVRTILFIPHSLSRRLFAFCAKKRSYSVSYVAENDHISAWKQPITRLTGRFMKSYAVSVSHTFMQKVYSQNLPELSTKY